MLLENAVKHNVISKEQPLWVEVWSRGDGALVVRNNIQRRNILKGSTKVGLENICKRYQVLSRQQVEISENDRIFEVNIPLLKSRQYELTDH